MEVIERFGILFCKFLMDIGIEKFDLAPIRQGFVKLKMELMELEEENLGVKDGRTPVEDLELDELQELWDYLNRFEEGLHLLENGDISNEDLIIVQDLFGVIDHAADLEQRAARFREEFLQSLSVQLENWLESYSHFVRPELSSLNNLKEYSAMKAICRRVQLAQHFITVFSKEQKHFEKEIKEMFERDGVYETVINF